MDKQEFGKKYDCMKKLGAVLVIVFFIAGVVLSFLAGNYMSNKEYMEERTQICRKYISFAIDTVQKKGLDLGGKTESIVSNLWVAHEFCDNPELSAELSNLWNILVYEEDTYITQEDKLAKQLENILKRCQ